MRFIFSFIVILYVTLAFASRPEDRFDDALRIRQLPGSEKYLRDYFHTKGVENIVYAVIFPISNCPRCESAIMPVLNQMKSVSPEASTVLVSVYPDSVAAVQYNNVWDLSADKNIFDTNKGYADFLSFSIGDLHIPYFMKLDVENGVLITGFPAEDNSSELMSEVAALQTPMLMEKFEIQNRIVPEFKPCGQRMKIQFESELKIPDGIRLSEVLYKPDLYGNKLAFNDKLRNAVELFELEEGVAFNFSGEVMTDDEENKRFITAPDSLLKTMYEGKEIKYMALSPKFLSDSKLAISYSLPNIWQSGPWAIGYMNEPSVLMLDLENDSVRNVYNYERIDGDKFYNAHFQIYNIGDKIVTACQKRTWPMSISQEDYKDSPEMNPFDDKFYSYPQPLLNVFEKRGDGLKMIDRIGRLSEVERKSLTGYYFSSPVLDSYEDEVAITDGVSGLVTVYDKECLDCPKYDYNVFDLDVNSLPDPLPEKFNTYECVTEFKPLLCRNIHDLKITPETLYALVRFGEHDSDNELDDYSFVIIDRKNGVRTEYVFPESSKEEKIMATGLWRKDNEVTPYRIVSCNGKWRLQAIR